MTLAESKRRFLRYIALTNSWGATVQRGKVYRPDVSDEDRRRVRECAFSHLERIATRYGSRQNEKQHVSNILELRDAVCGGCASHLLGGSFRFGSAQKLLNLYLKFLWCMDEIPEPPHLPLDRMVQVAAGLSNPVAWTQLNTAEEYLVALEHIRRAAGKSLAQWELNEGWKLRDGENKDG